MTINFGGLVMLYEIICDRFKQKKIVFHVGLNTILGDDIGSNSIGKTTLLMIIDFVFGGKDYVMLPSNDVQKNIGNHTIEFCFIFENEKYFFCRTTDDLDTVCKCDQNYKIISTITINDFCLFLKDKYQISLEDISFRSIVGHFSRVYGKENLDEKHPLNIVKNEKAGEPTNTLLKLFDLYKFVAQLDLLLKTKSDELSAYKNAQKYNYISTIGVKKYKENKKELENLISAKEQIPTDLDKNLLDLDSIKTEELLKLKAELSKAKRNRSHVYTQLKNIENNINGSGSFNKLNIEELFSFFPEASVRKFSDVEVFHKEIRDVLKFELNQRKAELLKLIDIANEYVSGLEKNISKISSCSNLSKAILVKYSSLQKKIENLQGENKSFDKLNALKEIKTEASERRDKMKKEQLVQLQSSINGKMLEINDFIYLGKKKPPVLLFDGNQYEFFTIDDTGTGTSYKSMIVYDLSILGLTELPILIHDSVLLKQISDVAIERILELYNNGSKQVFISFDKLPAYTTKSQNILLSKCVLKLSPGGNELFGWSWNDRENK